MIFFFFKVYDNHNDRPGSDTDEGTTRDRDRTRTRWDRQEHRHDRKNRNCTRGGLSSGHNLPIFWGRDNRFLQSHFGAHLRGQRPRHTWFNHTTYRKRMERRRTLLGWVWLMPTPRTDLTNYICDYAFGSPIWMWRLDNTLCHVVAS